MNKLARSLPALYSSVRRVQARSHSSWLHRQSRVRVSTLFAASLALGAGATALGLYEIYSSFTLWPEELRKDLRAGVRAKDQGNLALSERFLARAYQTALSLPLSALGSDPYLKLSGIAAVLAEVAPERRAKEVLRSAWNRGNLTSSGSSEGSDWATYTLTNEERLRRVALAYKLAELCTNEAEDEERWLVWAVEEVLRLAGVHAKTGGRSEAVATPIVLAELDPPSWMRTVDLGAPLAALGSVYAHNNNIELAMPLYLQAISLLVPPNKKDVSVDDRCEAAQLMNNISELIMRRPPSPEIRHQAETWARQAYGMIERAQEMPLSQRSWFGTEQSRKVCDQVLGVVLFNLGILREMDDDRASARGLYEQSLKQCEKVRMQEGVAQSRQALRRLERADSQSL